MAFKTLTQDQRVVPGSRVLTWGRPNTYKTTAIVETSEKPLQVISLPGEKGYETIPSVEGITSHVWEVSDLTAVNPGAVIREVETITAEVAAGKHGEFLTLAVEGVHKFYDFCYDAEFNELLTGANVDPEKIRGPAFGLAHKRVMRYLNKLSASTAANVIVTCWEADKKDDLKSRDKNAPTHKAPMLPGQLADWITGEYGASVRSTIKRSPDGKVVGLWQILPDPGVGGCAVKVPREIALRLPQKMPQHYGMLKALLSGKSVAEIKDLYPTFFNSKEEHK